MVLSQKEKVVLASVLLLMMTATLMTALVTSVNINVALLKQLREKKQKRKRVWAYPGSNWYETVLPFLPDQVFRREFRMTRATFDKLCELVEPHMKCRNSPRAPIPTRTRIAIGLYRLASSSELRVIGKKVFGVGTSTASIAFHEFVDAVNIALKDIIKFPRQEELELMAFEFERIGAFPGVVGAIDGMHVPISPPKGKEVDYYNFHGWHSLNCLAMVDANYQFRYFKAGFPGRIHDARIYTESRLFQAVERGHFKGPSKLSAPYTILGDSAFPLGVSLMKPFPHRGNLTEDQRKFNYILSKARRTVENAFGRLKARFRLLLRRMETGKRDLRRNREIIHAAAKLHNFCEKNMDRVSQAEIQEACRMEATRENRRVRPDVGTGTQEAVRLRNAIVEYCKDM